MNSEYDLKYYFVAFVDILGFTNMVKHDCEAPGESNSYIKRLFESYKHTQDMHKQSNEFDVIQFSDSIIFSMPFSQNKFPHFINIISNYQYELFKQGLLCRGGIAYGKHFSRDRFLFSDGLIEAYKLEKEFAKYPRIVVSKDLLYLIYKERILDENVHLLKENDDIIFIDFFGDNNLSDITEYLKSILYSSKSNETSITEKQRWLEEYFDFKVSKSRATHSKLSKPRFNHNI